jgi:hypothetical protein
MDVMESDILLEPTRERVFDVKEALVMSVDWPFFNFTDLPQHPFFLPQTAIILLALSLCSHMGSFRVDHAPNQGIIGIFGL